MVGPEVVGRPSSKARSGWGTIWQGRKLSGSFRQGRKWLGCPLAGPEVVGIPFGRARSGRGGPPAAAEVVGRPSDRPEVVGGPLAQP